MSPEGIANAIVSLLAAAGTLVSVVSRTRRRRNEIRENLSLAEELEKNRILREHTPAVAWLHGKIVLDVAKLAGQPLGAPKKPIPKGSVVFAGFIFLCFSTWTYWLNRDGFVWYSLVTGAIAASMAISILGMTTNREIPPDANEEIPDGAVPISGQSPSDATASAFAMASMAADGRYESEGQIGVAFSFLRRMAAGDFDGATHFADTNWLTCRVQSWIWNTQEHSNQELDLETTANDMIDARGNHELWEDFSAFEIEEFRSTWGDIDLDRLGAASRRRRIARDYDLVILAPTGGSGGYLVNSPTPVPGGLTFLMHHSEGHWLLSNHLGVAPPLPGLPPSWWTIEDPAINALPE